MYIVYLNGQNFNIQIRNSCHCMIAMDEKIKEQREMYRAKQDAETKANP